MDIISAYRDVGTYRGAAAISGTTPKTVKRVIARHESGGVAPARQPRSDRETSPWAAYLLVLRRRGAAPALTSRHVRPRARS